MKRYENLNELMNDRGIKILITKRANRLASEYQSIIETYEEHKVEERFDNPETWLPLTFSNLELFVFGNSVGSETINEIISRKIDWTEVRCAMELVECGMEAVKDAIVEKARASLENKIEKGIKEKITMGYAFCELQNINTNKIWDLTE